MYRFDAVIAKQGIGFYYYTKRQVFDLSTVWNINVAD